MSSISSIGKMVSGLQASQKGLQVTGHNIANVNTQGYTRQQLLQHETGYVTIGKNGGYAMQVGLGVSSSEIRQIRDDLADRRLRTESSALSYYQTLTSSMQEIEAIFNEPYGDTITEALNAFWSQTQKLNTTPDGVEERLSFINTAKVLIDKVNDVSKSLSSYQIEMNKQTEKTVKSINETILQIRDLNQTIAKAEVNGDNANDFRDQRNLLLDQLSTYGNISYYEDSKSGGMVVKFEGHIVVQGKFATTMEMAQTVPGSPFNKPVWSDTGKDVYNLKQNVDSVEGNDTGSLKALLIARGDDFVSSATTWDDVALNDNYSVDKTGNAFVIPKIQKMLNEFANKLTGIVNESFNGTGIGTAVGEAGVPVFVPIKIPDGITVPDASSTPEEIAAYNALLVPGNIQVNPELLAEGGYNKLGTVDGDVNNTGSNTKVTEFLEKWESDIDWFTDGSKSGPYMKTANITDFFSEFVTDIGTDSSLYGAKAKEKNTAVVNIENERTSIGGVSQDEEFSFMLKYQYAYNASARMITMLDGMLDTIINKL